MSMNLDNGSVTDSLVIKNGADTVEQKVANVGAGQEILAGESADKFSDLVMTEVKIYDSSEQKRV